VAWLGPSGTPGKVTLGAHCRSNYHAARAAHKCSNHALCAPAGAGLGHRHQRPAAHRCAQVGGARDGEWIGWANGLGGWEDRHACLCLLMHALQYCAWGAAMPQLVVLDRKCVARRMNHDQGGMASLPSCLLLPTPQERYKFLEKELKITRSDVMRCNTVNSTLQPRRSGSRGLRRS